MILYFNKDGQLLEKLAYNEGTPEAGTNEFSIFAYFEGLNEEYQNYQTAMLRLRRPDLQGSEYPDLFMTKEDLTFDSSIENSNYFKTNGGPNNDGVYPGFLFDFRTILDGTEPVILLDMGGTWNASITLHGTDGEYMTRRNVTGLLKFTVLPSVVSDDDDEPDFNLSALESNIRNLLTRDYVPYLGALKDVRLGNHDISARVFTISGEEMGMAKNEDNDLRLFNNEDGDIFLDSYVKLGTNPIQVYKIIFEDENEETVLHYIDVKNDNLNIVTGNGDIVLSPDGLVDIESGFYACYKELFVSTDAKAPYMAAKNTYTGGVQNTTTWSFYTEETEEIGADVHFASKEWVKPSIPKFQSGLSVIKDLTTNINGWELTNYDYEEVTISTYPAYKITTAGGETLTEAQARAYMRCMSGSDFLPTYDFNRPINSLFITAAGKILKPQFDNSNGLLLFKIDDIFVPYSGATKNIDLNGHDIKSEVSNGDGTKKGGFYLNADSSGSSRFEGYLKLESHINSTNKKSSIRYRAQDVYFIPDTTRGQYNYTINFPAEDGTFATREYVGNNFYTQAQVNNIISTLKRNSYRKVDITTYPTLNDFLATDGEEGYVYLYPINTSDLSQGYYQYIWEDDAWMDLGTSNVDLSGYATIDYVSANYATLEDLQQAISDALGTVESELDALDVGQGV